MPGAADSAGDGGGAVGQQPPRRERSGSVNDLPFVPLTRRWTFTGASKESDMIAAVYSSPRNLQQQQQQQRPRAFSKTGQENGGSEASSSTSTLTSATSSSSRGEAEHSSSSSSTNNSGRSANGRANGSAEASASTLSTPPPQSASAAAPASASKSGLRRELHKASVQQELAEGAAHLLAARPAGSPPFELQGDTEEERLSEARRLVRDHFQRLPNRYALNVEGAPEVVIDMRLMAEARGTDKVTVDVQPSDWDNPEEARSVITISCVDRPNLLDSITRIISRLSSTIVDADCMTSRDGLTLDRFVVEHKDLAEAVEGSRQRLDPNALRKVLETTLNGGEESIAKLSPSRLMKKSMSGSQSRGGATSTHSHSTSSWMSSSSTSSPSDPDRPPRGPGEGGEGGSSARDREAIPFEEIELSEVVGSGHSGSLWRAKWRDMLVAVKMIKVPDDSKKRQRFLSDFERERTIVRGLRHPNLCRFYGVSTPPGHAALVYDFLEGGSLAGLLRDRSRSYDLFAIAIDIAEGMDYLHKRGVMHRDLKPDNLLLNKDGRAVIADFGLVCPTISESDHTGETGTYRYMSSEVIRHEPYSTAADVYSFGIVLWELLTREQPFRGMTPIQAAFAVARQGHRPPLPPRTPPRLAQLIQACWHEDPIRRPTFSQAVLALKQIRAEIYGQHAAAAQQQQAQAQQQQAQQAPAAAGAAAATAAAAGGDEGKAAERTSPPS